MIVKLVWSVRLLGLLTGTDGEAIYEKDKTVLTLLGMETITKEAIDGKNIYTPCQRLSPNLLETQMDNFMEQTQGVNAFQRQLLMLRR